MPRAAHPSTRELRRSAFAALAATWPVILTLTLVISLISFLAGRFTGVPLVGLVVPFLLSVPSMGLMKGKLEHLRGTPLQFDCFFSMFPKWTKVICYELWVTLFLVLWMLPGLGLVLVGYVMLAAAGIAADSVAGTAALVTLCGGFVLAVVLLTRAVLNYAVSACLLADDPDMGGVAVLERSKAMMRGNRWRFVKLNLPIVLLNVAAAALTGSMGDVWQAALLSSLLSTVVLVLLAYFGPVFYRDLRGEG